MPETLTSRSPERRTRNSLTRAAILDAAERVAMDGFAGLTIRAVASELSSSPMALYRYFATKDELIDGLLDRVLGSFEQPDETSDWRTDLSAFARNHYAMLTAHQWAVASLISHPNPGPSALPIGETALAILARGGIAGDDAVAIFSGIVALNYGWASFVSARASVPLESFADAEAPAASPSEFPLTAEVAASFANYGSDGHYERVLAQFVSGLQAPSHLSEANGPR